MEMTTKWRCPCTSLIAIFYKKPHVVEPTVVRVLCPECKSHTLLKIKKQKGDQVQIFSRIVEASPVLAALLKEEAEFNAVAPDSPSRQV